MRRLLTLILILSSAWTASAQAIVRVCGIVNEGDTSLPVIQAAAQLLSPKDSSNLYGTVTDNTGKFQIAATEGDYILKLSYMGYETVCKTIHVTRTTGGLDLGTFILDPRTEFLEAAKVAAKVQPVTVKEDTIVFNPAAYRLAEDASLEDLLKKIPGLEVESGSVKLYGKKVNELRIDGKRFFGGDVRAGLENLTADMIDKIHAYERESDFTKMTGIDDGELVPVLDLKVKKNMLDGWRGDVNTAYGTSSKYAARLSARKFTQTEQNTVLANFNNLPSSISVSNATRTQLGSGSSGDIDRREAGYTFAKDLKKGDLDGNIHYYGTSRFGQSNNKTTSILSSGGSFSNSISESLGWSDIPKLEFQLTLRPNEKTTVTVKPSITYTHSDNLSNSIGGNFKKDPYERVEDPSEWLEIGIEDDPLDGIRNNSTRNFSETLSGKLSQSMWATVSRKLEKKGRTIAFTVSESYYWDYNMQGTNYRTYYYKSGSDTTRRQFVDTHNRIFSTGLQLSYNEPIKKGFNFQTIVRGDFRTKDYNKTIYDIASIDPTWSVAERMNPGEFRESLPEGYERTALEGGGSVGKYDWYALQINTNIRRWRKKYNYTVGLKFNPQVSVLEYPEDGVMKTMNSSVFNFAPNINVSYRPTSRKKLSLNYRSNSETPSVYNLLPAVNGTNPLYVHIGNPELKPAFSQIVDFSYNTANIEKQSSFIFNATWRTTKNKASNTTVYDPDTGGKTVTPMNISGDWGVASSLGWNKTLPGNYFTLSEHFSEQYNNYMSYLYNSKTKLNDVNSIRRLMVKDSFDTTFRNSWIELTLNLNGQYTSERSLLRPDMNQDPWSVGAGLNALFILPSLTRLSVEYSTIAQRGFNYSEFNRNYHVLNLNFSQPLFKKKATLRLCGYDLLGQLPNLTRSFGSESRSINTYNGVNRYVLLRFIYRFSVK